jgi:vacuolar-type H+-ATPase subunit I/STV1
MLSYLGSFFGYSKANVDLGKTVGRAAQATQEKEQEVLRMIAIRKEYEEKIQALHDALGRFNLPLPLLAPMPPKDVPQNSEEIVRKYVVISRLYQTLQKLKDGQLEKELDAMNEDIAAQEALASFLEKEIVRLREANNRMEAWNTQRQITALRLGGLIENADSK